MLILDFVLFPFLHFYVVFGLQIWICVGISLHTEFQVIQIKYRLDKNIFLGQYLSFINIFLNSKYDLKIYFETIYSDEINYPYYMKIIGLHQHYNYLVLASTIELVALLP